MAVTKRAVVALLASSLVAGCGLGQGNTHKSFVPSASTAKPGSTSSKPATSSSGSSISGMTSSSTANPSSSSKPGTNPSTPAAPTGPIDTHFAPTGSKHEMQTAILAELAKAKTSIDVAIFLFTSDDLADGLIKAKNRGVTVRALFDGGNANQVPLSVHGKLKSNGVDVKIVATPGTASGVKFHHKFCVIDKAVTITGSFNWTVDADETNYENIVIVRDANVSAAYSKEFDSLFTTGKGGVGTTNDIVFAPTGASKGIEKRIVAEMAKAKTEMVIAMYLFTSTDLTNAAVAALQRHVKVTLLFDARQKHLYNDKYTTLKNAGADIKLVTLGGSGAHTQDFHDKFCVIDGQVVITGSFNYVVNQDRDGYENIIVINDQTTAKAYIKTFVDAWSSPVAHP